MFQTNFRKFLLIFKKNLHQKSNRKICTGLIHCVSKEEIAFLCGACLIQGVFVLTVDVFVTIFLLNYHWNFKASNMYVSLLTIAFELWKYKKLSKV